MFINICRSKIKISRASTSYPSLSTFSKTSTTPKAKSFTFKTKSLSTSAVRTGIKSLHSQGFSVATAQQHNANQHLSSCFTGINRTMSMEFKGDSAPKHINRLAQEKSPYLHQHAHNPVDWYPWGDEAIDRAKQENKPIFLSVGYSTCHWCHVMAHESFEDEEVAKFLNEHFINIKVDREERPDVDKIYMQVVALLNRSGGWPMSVWLTPDLVPITAGTYFPATPRYGMPSFLEVSQTITKHWQENESDIKLKGKHLISIIQKYSSDTESGSSSTTESIVSNAIQNIKRNFDFQYGGRGKSVKFPEVPHLQMMFHVYVVEKQSHLYGFALKTLDAIGNGGIHDHIAGGFARYSVDRKWHVPHFEKMLYDQGLLMGAFANAYKLSLSNKFLQHADGIFRYIMKYLRHPAGGFYAGEDADSFPTATSKEKVEGAFYSWTWDEIEKAISLNASKFIIEVEKVLKIYANYYGIEKTGNVEPESDPHHMFKGSNILIVRKKKEDICEKYEISLEQLEQLLSTVNEILHKIRDERPRPHLDTKMICAWNGLILSGLSQLANCYSAKRNEYIEAATQLVKFMRTNFYDEECKVLLRACYGTEEALEISKNINGFLDDYSFFIQGLLDYYTATLDLNALTFAKELQHIQDSLFFDTDAGNYYYSEANAPNIIVRLKEDQDGAEPAASSIAAHNLILLSQYFNESSFKDHADSLLESIKSGSGFDHQFPAMLSALLLKENGTGLFVIVGPDAESIEPFLQVCRKRYLPGMILLHLNPDNPNICLEKRVYKDFKMIEGKPTVYICRNKVCQLPVTDPAKLDSSLEEELPTEGTC